MEIGPGTLLGKYRIEELISQGGFGLVYRATLAGPGGFTKTLAIKLLRAAALARPGAMASLINEARIIALLSHRNVVQVYEVIQQDDLCYLVMEYVDGVSLRQLKERTRLPLRLSVGISLEVCKALRYVHGLQDDQGRGRGIIHRDIKPSNILVSQQGDVRVTDFGVARSVDTGGQTYVGEIKGTPAYMSPEQCAGAPASQRSDVYSLGLVLFELCTGVLPRRKGLAPLPLASSVEPRVPHDLTRVLARALASDPAARPDAAWLERQLQVLLPELAPPNFVARFSDDLSGYVALALRTGKRNDEVGGATAGTFSAHGEDDGQAFAPVRLADEPETPKAAALVEKDVALTGPPRPDPGWLRRRSLLRWVGGITLAAIFVASVFVLVSIGDPSGTPPVTTADAGADAAMIVVATEDASLPETGAAPEAEAGALELSHDATPETDATPEAEASAQQAFPDAAPLPDAKKPGRRPRPTGRKPGRPGSRHPPAKKPRPEPEADDCPDAAGSGYVSVNADPWAILHVDGKRVGMTPLFRIPLPAGKRRILLVGPGGERVVRVLCVGLHKHHNLGLIRLQ